MAQARILLRQAPGSWPVRVNDAHPDIHVECIAIQAFPDGSVLTVNRLRGPRSQMPKAISLVEGDPSVSDFAVLHQTPEEACISALARNLPQVAAYLRSGVVIQPPFVLWGGRTRLTVVGTRGNIRAFLQRLGEAGLEPRLESITSAPEREKGEPLTSRQERAILHALRRGYYDVPRRCDLEDLSRSLGLSRSGLSELLRRGERRLIEAHAGPRPSPPPGAAPAERRRAKAHT
ncbi:MAG: helix-turn-helix domain-containing protein [Euryarchaeota archaeon]|nr:helix-turn-helix domain-containing protein [Euryarchaeota archaeon]